MTITEPNRSRSSRPELEHRPDPQAEPDRVAELRSRLEDLVGVDDPQAVADVMTELADLGDPGARVWLDSYRILRPGEEVAESMRQLDLEDGYTATVEADGRVALRLDGEVEAVGTPHQWRRALRAIAEGAL